MAPAHGGRECEGLPIDEAWGCQRFKDIILNNGDTYYMENDMETRSVINETRASDQMQLCSFCALLLHRTSFGALAGAFFFRKL